MSSLRIVVLGGGRSSEHDVSLRSAGSVAAGLREAGHRVTEVTIGRDGVWRDGGAEVAITPGRGLLDADAVFPVLHGPFGEDGSVQGLLETADVAYVGAGVLGSAVCMDKVLFKDLMARLGMPQVGYRAVDARQFDAEPDAVLTDLAALGLPVFVKPARLGSSVGIVRVQAAEALREALTQAFRFDPLVIVEAACAGLEVECSVLGNDDPITSEPGQIVLRGVKSGWYDYEAKYTPGSMELQVPAGISATARDRVRALAVDVFRHARAAGLARVDFFVEGEEVLVNELNTMPGFTQTSVYGALFTASGIEYPELLDRLVKLALERHQRERSYSF